MNLSRQFPLPFDTVMAQLPKELKKRGFKILSTCSIDKPFNELLDITFCRYSIISAAILPLAYRALTMDEDFGVVMPCNVAVYEKNEKTVISAIKPTALTHLIGDGILTNCLTLIERKLQDVLNAFERKGAKSVNSLQFSVHNY